MNGKRPPRRGYALLTVLVFVVLFLAMLGVAWRQIGAVLRIEAARAKQMSRDEGSLRAVAKGLRLLETGLPSEDEVSYSTTIDEGSQWYKVTFTRDPADETVWTVSAIPESSQSEEEMSPIFDNP
ncbi:MAG: hypothetical protein KKE86_11140 [Planctomycetes bacterium]|nr:hypothetical protein [Planctomycetota bacterium]MBU4399875.1 hypothetical protein [Planctomycetota bacterium]MCG2682670.1 hypothetical protein [Planctomycetales bacterium]